MTTCSHTVVGSFGQGLIAYKSQDNTQTLEFVELITPSRRDLNRKPITKRKSLNLSATKNHATEIIHASLQYLDKSSTSEKDLNSSKYLSNLHLNANLHPSSIKPRYALLSTVWKDTFESTTYYSASVILLLEKPAETNEQNGTLESGGVELVKINELTLVNKSEGKFHVHLLPPYDKPSEDEESDRDTTEEPKISTFKNRLIILNLDENILQFSIETFLHEESSHANIVLLSSEVVARSFWWAQWVPQYKFLVFAHDRKVRSSTFDEEDQPTLIVKPMLSVLQFHNDFPRESVLNMPLDIDTNSEFATGALVPDPCIISSKAVSLKVCAHSSGAVYLFTIRNHLKSEDTQTQTGGQPCPANQLKLKYTVNLLHHNKTLGVQCDLDSTQIEASSLPLAMDISTFANDQYLAVMGWPSFIHILDVGVTHEPSHHITLDFNNFISLIQPLPLPSMSSPFCMMLLANNTTISTTDDKFSAFAINFANQDLTLHQVPLSPAKLHQLLEKSSVNTKVKLALIHYILVHVGDINVCKRIIYDEGKKIGNLNLSRIYQEFLVGAAYAQTKKQLLPNMEQFLSLIPYCPHNSSEYNGAHENLSIVLNTNWTEVCSMLLSPSQRVFPHNVTDVWTSLWQMNKQIARSNRFSQKNVADKLLLALQCYKPEALSKASTPMSPSSPMVCASLGDIAGLFGRRTTELQLPFVEHESCTANKQEYIFSINLRELSMHLLKERKEYPLLGHTVAGKYVCALVDTARLLCHLACLTVHLQPTKNRDKGYRLIDCLEWETKLRLFMLLEHYALALGKLACPLPQGFTPFFAYLAYKVVSFDQFIWHVRAGSFELQIDLVKTIMADLKDSDQESVARKLRLLSLLPKSRAYRILNSWSHPISIALRARQHSNDLLSGTVSQARKSSFVSLKKKKGTDPVTGKTNITALDSFFQLLTGKANATDIDLGLLTEATMLSMEQKRD